MDEASIKSRFTTLEKRMNGVEDEVESVKNTLTGTFERPGVLEIVRRIDSKIEAIAANVAHVAEKTSSLEVRSNKSKAWLAGAMAVGGAIVGFAMWIVPVLLKIKP